MKAAVIESIGGGFTFADIDVAAPEGAEVLIDVKASGLCQTDLTFARHDLEVPMPALFGHVVAGVVAVIGPNVRSLRVGDHVVACNIPFCGYARTAAVAAPTYAPIPPSRNERMATRRDSVATASRFPSSS
jgi:S-(hydroxymethyl)glutathione dehydrogenase/alcohol dehydrogenase